MDTKFGTLVSGVKQIQSPTTGASRNMDTVTQANIKTDAGNRIDNVNPAERLSSNGIEANGRGVGKVDKLPNDDDTASLDEVVANLNKQVQQSSRALQFSVDDRQGKPVVLVIDMDTEKVIRQIPSEVALQVSDALEEATNAGVLVSEHA